MGGAKASPPPLSSLGAADCWGRGGEDAFPSASNDRYRPSKISNSSLCWGLPVPGPALSTGTLRHLGHTTISFQGVRGPDCETEAQGHGHPVGAGQAQARRLLAGTLPNSSASASSVRAATGCPGE